jgi:hypothetical protein
MNNPHVDANCPLGYGNTLVADTTRGITLDTSMLGQVYHVMGEGSLGAAGFQTVLPRYVMIAKNSSGSTLARNLVVAHTTTTGVSFPYNIAGLAGALSLVASGVIEDGYLNGVPDGAYFRMVVEGMHYVTMKTASDALVTTVVGQRLCCAASGTVIGQDTSVAAGAATFAQINSVVGTSATITTNTVENGLPVLHHIKMAKL